jgi:hypothetical protein
MISRIIYIVAPLKSTEKKQVFGLPSLSIRSK